MPVLSVVIPAYNEEERLPRTIEQIERYLDGKREYELILVDDGSTDGTRQLMEAAAKRNPKVRVEALPGNRGKGRALASGVAVARGDDVLVTDADLSTPIEELEKLEDALKAGAGVADIHSRLQRPSVGFPGDRYRAAGRLGYDPDAAARCFDAATHAACATLPDASGAPSRSCRTCPARSCASDR